MSRRDRKNNWAETGRGLSLILQLGLSVLVPLFLCLALGIWLQDRFRRDWIVLVMLVLGILAGGRNAYVLARDYIRDSERRDRKKFEREQESLSGKDRPV